MTRPKDASGQRAIWGSLNRILWPLLFLCILALLASFFIPEIQRHRQEQAEIQRLTRELERQEILFARKSREIDLLRTDPSYVETIARDKLDLMKEGETIFRIDPKSAPGRTP